MSKSMKNQIKAELEKLLPGIEKVTHMIHDAEEEWTEHYRHDIPEEQYLRVMFYRISNDLKNGEQLIKRTFTEVDDEGVLYKQSDGRYGFGHHSFYSGSQLEYLDNDEDYGRRWVHSHIDHKDGDYCMRGTKTPLEGMRVRIKRVPR